MTGNGFEALLQEIAVYKRHRDGGEPARRREPASPVSGRQVSGRSLNKAMPVFKLGPPVNLGPVLAELEALGTRQRALAKSLTERTADLQRELAVRRSSEAIARVAAKAHAAAKAGQLTGEQAAQVDIELNRARQQLIIAGG